MFWLKQLWVQRTLQARPSHWTTVLVSLHSVFGELGFCSRHIKRPLKGCRPWTIFSVLLLLLQQSDGKVKWSSVLSLLISCWHFSCFTKLSVSWLNSTLEKQNNSVMFTGLTSLVNLKDVVLTQSCPVPGTLSLRWTIFPEVVSSSKSQQPVK